jgi:hypothetical protein
MSIKNEGQSMKLSKHELQYWHLKSCLPKLTISLYGNMTTTLFTKEPSHSSNIPNRFRIPVREWFKVHDLSGTSSQMLQLFVSLYPLGEMIMPYTSIPEEYHQPFELALQILHTVHGLGTDVLEQIPIVFTQEKHLGSSYGMIPHGSKI